MSQQRRFSPSHPRDHAQAIRLDIRTDDADYMRYGENPSFVRQPEGTSNTRPWS